MLTYTKNRGRINDKKGGDGGIDGTAFMLTGKGESAKIVFQVKSGGVGRGDISKMNNDRQRENAELAVFLTLEEPTAGMKTEATAAGFYTHPNMGESIPRVQIVTVAEMLAGAQLKVPLALEVLKTAKAVVATGQDELSFGDDDAA